MVPTQPPCLATLRLLRVRNKVRLIGLLTTASIFISLAQILSHFSKSSPTADSLCSLLSSITHLTWLLAKAFGRAGSRARCKWPSYSGWGSEEGDSGAERDLGAVSGKVGGGGRLLACLSLPGPSWLSSCPACLNHEGLCSAANLTHLVSERMQSCEVCFFFFPSSLSF